jgi:hypothetical protein
VKKAGFENFPVFAAAMTREHPLKLAGEPVQKISEGFLCLNDPGIAQTSLATFQVNAIHRVRSFLC